MKLNLVWLYPDLMNTYGDRGNVLALVKRAQDRGISVQVHNISIADKFPTEYDLIFMGGAQDRQQKLVVEDLHSKKNLLAEAINEGLPCLFICAGYQLLGHYYQLEAGERIPGLGIFDLHTIHPGADKPRLIGNFAAKQLFLAGLKRATLVGFENHGGRSYLGHKAQPLSKVAWGFGNNGEDGTEGIVLHNTLGTYLHGPLLPKNPHLTDYLLLKALQRHYKVDTLSGLDDETAWRAHAKAYEIARSKNY